MPETEDNVGYISLGVIKKVFENKSLPLHFILSFTVFCDRFYQLEG